LRISFQTWRRYRSSKALGTVCEIIDDVIYDQKFTGAVVGIFKANIIARELGLTYRRKAKYMTSSSSGALADFYREHGTPTAD